VACGLGLWDVAVLTAIPALVVIRLVGRMEKRFSKEEDPV
jgi:uncharacterized membrane protein YhiD involved in acid resistance